MIASLLFCTLPFLAVARVRESWTATSNLQTSIQMDDSARQTYTGICTRPSTGVNGVSSEVQCGLGSNSGTGYVSLVGGGTIIDASSCASEIVNVCKLATNKPTYISFGDYGSTKACYWFASCSTSNLDTTSPNVPANPSNAAATIPASKFTTMQVQDGGNGFVHDSHADYTRTQQALNSGEAVGDEDVSLSQTPQQIQMTQAGENAGAVLAAGKSVGQNQQDCPGSYEKSIKRGEWQCVKQPDVGAMMMICSAGLFAFVVVFVCSHGVGYKLRNKGLGGDDGETMGGEFEEEGEYEEEEEL